MRDLPLLSRADESSILAVARTGDELARRQVLQGNLELAAVLALRLAPPWLAWLDAMQEANLVLLQTVDDDSVAVPATCLASRILDYFNSLNPPDTSSA